MKAEFAAYARRVAGSALYWGKNSRVEKEGEISRFLPIFPHLGSEPIAANQRTKG
jgi:hypothetical protein